MPHSQYIVLCFKIISSIKRLHELSTLSVTFLLANAVGPFPVKHYVLLDDQQFDHQLLSVH